MLSTYFPRDLPAYGMSHAQRRAACLQVDISHSSHSSDAANVAEPGTVRECSDARPLNLPLSFIICTVSTSDTLLAVNSLDRKTKKEMFCYRFRLTREQLK